MTMYRGVSNLQRRVAYNSTQSTNLEEIWRLTYDGWCGQWLHWYIEKNPIGLIWKGITMRSHALYMHLQHQDQLYPICQSNAML